MTVLLPFRRYLLGAAWCRNFLWKNARAVPSLDLDFAGTKSLKDGISNRDLVTFTRASSGTYVGSDGLIKTATTNEALFDHNPTTTESLGLLVEEARTNLVLQSENFGTTWALTGLLAFGSGSTLNAATAPDGASTADLITENTSTGNHLIQQSVAVTTGTVYTYAVYAKLPAGSTRQVTLLLANTNFTVSPNATFNLSSGTVVATFNGTASIVSLPGNWYRLVLTTVAATSSGSNAISIRLHDGTSNSYTGDGTSGIYIWGAQLEAGAFATSYIPTTSATVTRAADVASITGSNFSSFYNQTEGTVFADAISPATSTTVFAISDNSTNNRIQIETGSSNRRFRITASGSAKYDNSVAYTFGTSGKSVGAYIVSGSNHATNGVLGVDLAGSPLPVVDRLLIGTNAAGAFYHNGTIKRLVYWGQRLPNNVLQAITQ